MITIIYNLMYTIEGKWIHASVLAGTLDLIIEGMLLLVILECTK